mmetsp:Transcript_42612/g.106591  ORF Transcript_42612/g.106591 Transcript_42612/m.106591 type:complete len:283 (-) Transcript_42612:40-888(-)
MPRVAHGAEALYVAPHRLHADLLAVHPLGEAPHAWHPHEEEREAPQPGAHGEVAGRFDEDCDLVPEGSLKPSSRRGPLARPPPADLAAEGGPREVPREGARRVVARQRAVREVAGHGGYGGPRPPRQGRAPAAVLAPLRGPGEPPALARDLVPDGPRGEEPRESRPDRDAVAVCLDGGAEVDAVPPAHIVHVFTADNGQDGRRGAVRDAGDDPHDLPHERLGHLRPRHNEPVDGGEHAPSDPHRGRRPCGKAPGRCPPRGKGGATRRPAEPPCVPSAGISAQ